MMKEILYIHKSIERISNTIMLLMTSFVYLVPALVLFRLVPGDWEPKSSPVSTEWNRVEDSSPVSALSLWLSSSTVSARDLPGG